MAQTEAVLKSTGGAANVTAEQVVGLANRLRDLTGIDDEAIQASSNLLLTFREVHNEVGKGNDIFNQAQTAILDMATALNEGAIPSTEDLHSATIQLGKALNDPIQGMTALKRVGVSFTEAQVKQIEAMQKSGDLMGAQKLILEELQLEFGGAAKAAGKTFAGQLAILKSQLEDVFEEVGKALLPVIQKLTNILAKVLVPVLKVAADNLDLMVAALAGFWAFKTLPTLLFNIGAGLQSIGFVQLGGAIGNVGLAAISAGGATIGFVGAMAAVPVVAFRVADALAPVSEAQQTVNDRMKEFAVVRGPGYAQAVERVSQAQADGQAKAQLLAGGITDLSGTYKRAEKVAFDFSEGLSKGAKKIAEAVRAELPEIVGTVTRWKDVFTLSPQELVNITNSWVRIGQTMADDLREIADSDLKPAMREAIAALPPEMRHAWVEGNAKQRAAIQQSLRQTFDLEDVVARLVRQALLGGTSIGRSFGQGMIAGLVAVSPAIQAQAEAAVLRAEAAARRAAQAESPSKLMERLGEDLMLGLRNGIDEHDQEIADRLQEVIQGAIDRLQAKASDFRNAVQGAFASFMDLPGAFAAAEGASVGSVLGAQLHQARQFADVLRALRRQGASAALISQIAGAGPEALGFAQALLQGGPEMVRNASATLREIQRLADQTAKSLTQQFFGQKIDTLHEDLVNVRQILHRIADDRVNGDLVLQVDGQTFARISRDQLLKLKGSRVSLGLS